MSDMNRMVTAVLRQASPVELRHMACGDLGVAEWLVRHVFDDLTPTQETSVAERVIVEAEEWLVLLLTLRAQEEIGEDLDRGTVPAFALRGFADLHDYVDANEYGGLCDESIFPLDGCETCGGDAPHPHVCPDCGLATEMSIVNEVQGRLDEWIRAGHHLVGRVYRG